MEGVSAKRATSPEFSSTVTETADIAESSHHNFSRGRYSQVCSHYFEEREAIQRETNMTTGRDQLATLMAQMAQREEERQQREEERQQRDEQYRREQERRQEHYHREQEEYHRQQEKRYQEQLRAIQEQHRQQLY